MIKSASITTNNKLKELLKELYKNNIIDKNEMELFKHIKLTNLRLLDNKKKEIGKTYNDLIPLCVREGIDIFIEKLLQNELNGLTDDQKIGITQVIKFCYDDKMTFGLYGYAGTGKTTTIIELIYVLLKYNLISSLALTAPTNKATDIIKSKFKKCIDILCTEKLSFDDKIEWLKKHKKIDIQILTIHKLLNYGTDFDVKGNKIFVKKGKTNINKFDVIIIDECSMIPSKFIPQLIFYY